MPNNAWPPGITTAFWAEGFALKPQPVTIRTDMDTGPPKVRRRFINPVRTYACDILLKDADEYTLFDDFFYVTCKAGTDTILMPHPITGVDTVFRFVGEPEYSAVGIAWRVAFSLEELP
jgi:hypothetical protein